MITVALLRGINVGGRNKISMAALRGTFERLGFQQVASYINSGNVIYHDPDPRDATPAIEAAIRKDFGLEIPVLLRDIVQMRKLSRALPGDWVNDRDVTANALFLWRSLDRPDIVKRVGAKPDLDEVRYVPGALLWRVSKSDLKRSGLMKLAGSELYRGMTVRNVNTVRKVTAIMEGLAGADPGRR
jgi:uncharacterized protein (DUF1697 family)